MHKLLTTGLACLFLVTASGTAADKPKLQDLLKGLKSKDAEVRSKSAADLGALKGAEQKPAAAALVRAVKDEEGLVRLAAVKALAKLKPEPKLVVTPLAEALKDVESQVVIAAAQELGRIGAPAKDAADELKEASKSNDKRVARAAKAALEKVTADPKKPGK